MDADLKTKWIEALRSGRFEQSTRALKKIPRTKDSPTHCCLGVLCEVAGLPSSVNARADAGSYGAKAVYAFTFPGSLTPHFGVLPVSFQQDLGLTGRDVGYLMDMNDGYGKSFAEIADWIEENVKID